MAQSASAAQPVAYRTTIFEISFKAASLVCMPASPAGIDENVAVTHRDRGSS